MLVMIILNFTKKGLALSLEIHFEKIMGGLGQIEPNSLFRVKSYYLQTPFRGLKTSKIALWIGAIKSSRVLKI